MCFWIGTQRCWIFWRQFSLRLLRISPTIPLEMYGLAGTKVDRVYTGECAVRSVAQDARVEMLASIAVSVSEDELIFTDRGRHSFFQHSDRRF